MIGRTILRWLAASGRPAALAQAAAAAATSPSESTVNDTVVPHGGNRVTRMIQRNRVLTASGIVVVLFTYGGFAWSARPSTRLVRKSMNPIPDVNEDFGALLNLPPFQGHDEQRPGSGNVAPTLDVTRRTAATLAYDPFEESPQLDVADGDHLPFSDVKNSTDFDVAQPILAVPTTHQPPQLDAPTTPAVSFPSLGLPEFSAPQLDNTADQAEPLPDSSNPFQSQ